MKRVLIIGHNVFDKRTALGKTLLSFFSGWSPDRLAQLYFHSEVPTCRECQNYYRITDKEALKSFLNPFKKIGRKFKKEDIRTDAVSSRTDSGITSKIYSFGRKRTPLIYILRNLIWVNMSRRKSGLLEWVKEFNPDVIFFAAGDYKFAYDITSYIAKLLNIPVVMYCSDDYYINRLNPDLRFSNVVYKHLMKSVFKTVSHTSHIITICDKMAKQYSKLFDVPITTVYTGYSRICDINPDGERIAYLGNLGFSRYECLIDIGRVLKGIKKEDGTYWYLDVYSTENREHILKHLTSDNGIVFHGAVGQKQVEDIIDNSLLVVHTESFSEENIYKVKYSVSTKIADLLASGHCILAYGPNNIASIEYLAENNSACVINKKEDLKETVLQIIGNREKRQKYINNAHNLAMKNHSPQAVAKEIKKIIEEV